MGICHKSEAFGYALYWTQNGRGFWFHVFGYGAGLEYWPIFPPGNRWSLNFGQFVKRQTPEPDWELP